MSNTTLVRFVPCLLQAAAGLKWKLSERLLLRRMCPATNFQSVTWWSWRMNPGFPLQTGTAHNQKTWFLFNKKLALKIFSFLSTLRSSFPQLRVLLGVLPELPQRVPPWLGKSDLEVRKASGDPGNDPWHDCPFTFALRAGSRGEAGVLDPDVCVLCHGDAVYAAGAQREGLRQSPDRQHGQDPEGSGLPRVLLCGGGERCLLPALYKHGIHWRSVPQTSLVWIQ